MDALPSKDWTVLVYQGGVNNLDSNLRANLKELAASPHASQADVLVRQVDSKGDSRDFQVEDQCLKPLSPTRSDVNSADPAHLAEFLEWGMRRFPSRHYALVISSHGQGAEGVIEDERKGSVMPLSQFAQALRAAGRPLDLLFFDACRMQTVEVASELRGQAEVVVGSMDRIGNQGYDPAVFLAEVARSPDPRSLAQALVRHTEPRQLEMFSSLSAVDLKESAGLEKALAGLAEQLVRLEPDCARRVRQIATDTRRALPSPIYQDGLDNMAHALLQQPFPQARAELEEWLALTRPADPVALLPLCQNLLADPGLPAGLKSSLRAVIEAERRVVFARRGEGLSVRLPIEQNHEARPLAFDQATGWQVALANIVPLGSPAKLPPSWVEERLAAAAVSGLPPDELKRE